MDADYVDDMVLLEIMPTKAESQLHCLEQAAGDIGLLINTDMQDPAGEAGMNNRHSLMDPYIWMCQCWSTKKNVPTTALYRHRM